MKNTTRSLILLLVMLAASINAFQLGSVDGFFQGLTAANESVTDTVGSIRFSGDGFSIDQKLVFHYFAATFLIVFVGAILLFANDRLSAFFATGFIGIATILIINVANIKWNFSTDGLLFSGPTASRWLIESFALDVLSIGLVTVIFATFVRSILSWIREKDDQGV